MTSTDLRAITTLKPNQVFVFGSNRQGFHGAGSAGYAMRGDSRNNWRQDTKFLALLEKYKRTKLPQPGKWAELGKSYGLQTGTEGSSWAIITVTHPGAKRSISRRQIYEQLVSLWKAVKVEPELEFIIAPLAEGYAGYTHDEMEEVWNHLFKTHGKPNNITRV